MNKGAEHGLQLCVQPWTAKKGVGYALLANYDEPKVVTVMVSHGKLRRVDAAALPEHCASSSQTTQSVIMSRYISISVSARTLCQLHLCTHL